MKNIIDFLKITRELVFLPLLVLLCILFFTYRSSTPQTKIDADTINCENKQNIKITQIFVTHPKFNKKQHEILTMAYKIGKGINFPETIQAIVLQESSAGISNLVGDTNSKFGKRSYGIMQVKLGTAKLVLKEYNSIFDYKFSTDEGLIVDLITNPKFNIKIGAYYFKMIYDKLNNYESRWSTAVFKYNRGFGGEKDLNNYTIKIKNRITKEVRPFNAVIFQT